MAGWTEVCPGATCNGTGIRSWNAQSTLSCGIACWLSYWKVQVSCGWIVVLLPNIKFAKLMPKGSLTRPSVDSAESSVGAERGLVYLFSEVYSSGTLSIVSCSPSQGSGLNGKTIQGMGRKPLLSFLLVPLRTKHGCFLFEAFSVDLRAWKDMNNISQDIWFV